MARTGEMVAAGDYWEMLMPSESTQPTPALEKLYAHSDQTKLKIH
jgi:hypothetical protein